MSYIEKEKAIRHLKIDCITRYPSSYSFGLSAGARELEKLPSADVVEVVRCRDCKHNRDNGGDCDRTIILNEYDSTEYRYAGLEYCSYGERKEE